MSDLGNSFDAADDAPPLYADVGAKTTGSAIPDKDSQVTSQSGKIILNIPKGAVASTLDIEIIEHTTFQSTGTQVLSFFELNAFLAGTKQKVTQFSKGLQVTIKHNHAELAGLDPATLHIYWLDETTGEWVPVAGSHYDPKLKTTTAAISHFSRYGEMANRAIVGPGRVLASQSGMNSGAATFSYPIELPPGPGGFAPALELTYSSAVADEMKNKQSMGSWVGIGWTLHPGRISYDPYSGRYFLEINGYSYEIFSTDDTHYRTNPEQYFQITRTGETWEMLDPQGTYYRFGGTADSQQYLPQNLTISDPNYRWDLSLFRDTNGNYATISYTQDIRPDPYYPWVRSAYPSDIFYGNVQIHFSTSWDVNAGADGYLRNDDPVTYGSNPAPYVMENRKLDYIEVKASGNLIRKYSFAYTTTAKIYSASYGGVYYSGNHTLTSITQKGTDGTSALPVTSFTYLNLQTYRRGAEVTYVGNPGNAALFTWPHLNVINTGYGGSTTFTYSQKPSPAVTDTWSREVVTGKTINRGIGPNETHTFAYYPGNGTPQYRGTGWDQTYRGFTQVKETDAAGNYINHFYYTKDMVGGVDGDKLAGLEYDTQWFSSTGVNLRERIYTWSWVNTSQTYDVRSAWSLPGAGTSSLLNDQGVGASAAGNVYVSDAGLNAIKEFDDRGNYLLSWGSTGSGPGQFNYPTGVGVDSSGYVYVADLGNNRIQKFTSTGTFVTAWGSGPGTGNNQFNGPNDVAIDGSGNVYVVDAHNNRVQKFTSSGTFISTVGTGYGSGDGQFNLPISVALDSAGNVYVTDYNNKRVQKFNSSGTFVMKWGTPGSGQGQFNSPTGIAVDGGDHVYVGDASNFRIEEFDTTGGFVRQWYNTWMQGMGSSWDVAASAGTLYEAFRSGEGFSSINQYIPNWAIHLDQVDEITGTKTARTRYLYDTNGNVITEYHDGDIGGGSPTADDYTIQRVFSVNLAANILSLPARERTYATISGDVGGASLMAEANYYYDNQAYAAAPLYGNLTRIEQKADAATSANTYYAYDANGNVLNQQDPNGNTTVWTYDASGTYPATKTYPITALFESYTYDPGTNNLLSQTDVNNGTINYQYDTFKRPIKVFKQGNDPLNNLPDIQYNYNTGSVTQQNNETIIRISPTETTWSRQFFDGMKQAVQVQSKAETGSNTMVDITTVYSNRGLVDKVYVSQKLGVISTYQAPVSGWKYTSYTYDGLGRVLVQTNPDATTISHAYTDWQDTVTDQLGHKKRNTSNAFGELAMVEEYNSAVPPTVYATSTYTYDVLGNLVQFKDNSNNIFGTTYDWLSRKTAMSDPDMGNWSYQYDSNGNLTQQVDGKSQTLTFAYDAINRLTGKSYWDGSISIPLATYSYDSGPYGKGQRTGMWSSMWLSVPPQQEATSAYTFDQRGRLTGENLVISADLEPDRDDNGGSYTTAYTFDGADRLTTVTYPTGETVTQTYNGRGLPATLIGSSAGTLVSSTSYNQLGGVTQIAAGNGVTTEFKYHGLDALDSGDATSYYGELYKIRTYKGSTNLLQLKYWWDAAGNLSTRKDGWATIETETFGYDFLNRLTSASATGGIADYSETYSYNQIGNMLSKGGQTYTYPTPGSPQPHAVTNAGYDLTYDSGGNMTFRHNVNGTQSMYWDRQNQLFWVEGTGIDSDYSTHWAFSFYDGNGQRLRRYEDGVNTHYPNRYSETNVATGEVTSYYYLGDALIALKNNSGIQYIHQDSLGSTVLTTDGITGSPTSSARYLPYGDTRVSSGSSGTDIGFTGQRHDSGSDLYFFNSRFEDQILGRFVKADTIIPGASNPQAWNRYSYAMNNPLRYNDPTGHGGPWDAIKDALAGVGEVGLGVLTGGLRWVLNPGPMTAQAFMSVSPLTSGIDMSQYYPMSATDQQVDDALAWLGSLQFQEMTPAKAIGVSLTYTLMLGVGGGWGARAGAGKASMASEARVGEEAATKMRIPSPEVAGLGSTIRGGMSHLPRTVSERLAVEEAMNNPSSRITIIDGEFMEARWPGNEGWVKKAYNSNGIEVHFNYNKLSGKVDDIKIIGK